MAGVAARATASRGPCAAAVVSDLKGCAAAVPPESRPSCRLECMGHARGAPQAEPDARGRRLRGAPGGTVLPAPQRGGCGGSFVSKRVVEPVLDHSGGAWAGTRSHQLRSARGGLQIDCRGGPAGAACPTPHRKPRSLLPAPKKLPASPRSRPAPFAAPAHRRAAPRGRPTAPAALCPPPKPVAQLWGVRRAGCDRQAPSRYPQSPGRRLTREGRRGETQRGEAGGSPAGSPNPRPVRCPPQFRRARATARSGPAHARPPRRARGSPPRPRAAPPPPSSPARPAAR